MEMTGAPLTRTFTAPLPTHTRLPNSTSSSTRQHHQSHPESHYSNYSHPSRSSESTQDTAHSTLFLPAPTFNASNGGPVGASNNVINKVGDRETSLFQICVNLRNRLRGVPGFEEQLLEVEDEELDEEDTDPVTLLWRTFRRGYPLLTIYNALEPDEPLELDGSKFPVASSQRAVERRQKAAAFMFLKACLDRLKVPSDECFMISDLYGDDTSGFVRVAKVVNRVVDILVQEGYLASFEGHSPEQEEGPLTKRTQRQHIVDELVRTERTYVQHLEVLQSFKKQVENKGVIPGDAIYDIFLNLNPLLDFQRRFLIRVEQINRLPEPEQNWGKIFILYRNAFVVYELYIANQKKCEETAMREFDKLRDAGGSVELRQIVESPTHLTSFLLKPFQRLSKYPLLLRELRDKGDLDEERRTDISEAIEVVASVLERTNAEIAKEERKEVVQALKGQVEDWKRHEVEGFGALLLHGQFTVMKGDVTKDSPREYRMYLFERILLCCKEANPNKQKNKIVNRPQQPPPERKGLPRLHLKGRIFMQNVTETVFLAKPGSYTCQIYWRGDEGIEYFIIKFQTEETMKRWRTNIETQRRICLDFAKQHLSSTSETEFTYIREQIREQGVMQNPYEEDENLDGEDSGQHTLRYSDSSTLVSSRNGSNTSLRSRSTTGESGPPMSQSTVRAAPNRYPGALSGQQPLKLRTQLQSGVVSPGERVGQSYFSPMIDSPMSVRTSGSSGMFPFPRQPAPQQNGWHGEDPVRFTAPAGTRLVTHDANGYYQIENRNGRVPTANAQPAHHTAFIQNRLRSVSSPDMQNTSNAVRRSAPNAPPVPNVPSHLVNTPGVLNRSQSNSPTNSNGGQPRATAQSPISRRLRGQNYYPHQQGYDGSYAHTRSSLSQDVMAVPTLPELGTSASPLGLALSTDGEISTPSQLKVKVRVPSEGSHMTLVVAFNISYQSLKDRIDAKLHRHSKLSLGSGTVKLKYQDEDELVSIQTDEDVQIAFETWKDQQQDHLTAGQLGEIELYCIQPAD